ncbi:MAG: indolepyruvate oxidoreductase subunit beta family protein, partial [Burkholderiales bacterium]|nr:indolepyruvate oxidoreductase subunit beta family protein [Burkholderiales bacterium]
MACSAPVSVLIAALGGDGGGVLAGWIIAAAERRGYPVQGTSIPGVSQRTGATTYYVEMYPQAAGEAAARAPVMALAAVPGCVDVMLATELLEAGRAMLAGFVAPGRTTLIASTHRVYTVAEKMQMGDGRFDETRLLSAAQSLARRTVLFDMRSVSVEAGTVVNAVLFGALAGSGALPLERADCEAAIRQGGRGAEASLRGFELGFERALALSERGPGSDPSAAAPQPRAQAPRIPSGSARAALLERCPQAAREMVQSGVERVADYQDESYAELYAGRLAPLAEADQRAASGGRLLGETARQLALWMSYEDLIRVADLKSRRARFERIRDEVKAKPGEPVHVIEYFKPRLEEIAAVLPRFLAAPLARRARAAGAPAAGLGLHLRTSTVSGFLLLRLLAVLRPLRRRTSRYAEEQALIGRWLAAIEAAAASDAALALEIAQCARLLKGYGDTHRRGRENFLRIMDTLVRDGAAGEAGAQAAAIRQAREAALADPEGLGLDRLLESHRVPARPPVAKPL